RSGDPDHDDCLRITLDKIGDSSTYRLCFVEVATALGQAARERPFHGLDPRYACVQFRFRLDCAADIDCRSDSSCAPPVLPAPEIDYLTKDYASLRRLMLDRLALTMPAWREQHVPDLGVTLVELLAYTADYLSYYQDAVATEAYLDTARQRISVRRHVRLIDYRMHEGCNARAWVTLESASDVGPLPLAGLYFITGFAQLGAQAGAVLSHDTLARYPASAYEVFEPLASDPQCFLILSGEDKEPARLRQVLETTVPADMRSRVRIVDATPPEFEHAFYLAADAAVFLERRALPYYAACVARCLACGMQVIFNANGEMTGQVVDALIGLERRNKELAFHDATLRAGELIVDSSFAEIYQEALQIQHGLRSGSIARQSTNETVPLACRYDAAQRHVPQLLVDVSIIATHNLHSGIQRVVRNVLLELLKSPPAGYRVMPVREFNGHYAYATGFAASLLQAEPPAEPDQPIAVNADDVFLGLDLFPYGIQRNLPLFDDLKRHGVRLYFVLYDLLPVRRPDVFPREACANFSQWLETVTRIGDGIVGISRAVADDLADWMATLGPRRAEPLQIGYFHLGADLLATKPHAARNDAIGDFLMVGTVEPRKGYAQALDAFDRMWKDGVDARLAIVGKQGWMVDELAARLRSHPEYCRRLFWFESADDGILARLYTESSALLLASEAEGFGLPLVEAAQYDLPIVARNLPVFREVAGAHAYYFDGQSGDSLARALREWMQMRARNAVPHSSGLRRLDWTESAAQLMRAVIGSEWYRNSAELPLRRSA
ncbi:glycosyltransferase, partial [Oxalobacteraceae bacterium OM1]